ncbi:MAG TPA: 50S ribosomal protein L11 methyltransferase [Polyangiaceae bacterium]|jgi:predicted nicotinamide N-methyase|nr:MAG: ribosomal protein L11 methyltransferase [Deltaproteobacteria bacterium ADurb.Bin207]HNS98594.1 50S ribosomal protein L11 methyltransferase [Polyangiaceae bacterium]HNZ23782.1 50S ribosomal protein L11 methyltransferase [Polyangiaceae bacterium]HOD24561.1 50S ribosomal protein L11 methyltransferase [Polyangiaceae bacterium]HOE50163.1 50S ribosomal protein L11 methyltransferase [Polyangiaceae bacterium]
MPLFVDPVHEALIVRHTALSSPRLCPDILLHLITPAQPLWRAGQAELDALGLADPFWAFCWPGGQALAYYISRYPESVRGKRVLAFGAGCGVEAIAAARCGAEVLASDTDPVAATAILLNARRNNVSLRITTDNLLGNLRSYWDIVLVGDVTYERELAKQVRAWVTQLAHHGSRVLVADPQRGFFDREGWITVAAYTPPADDDEDGTKTVMTPVLTLG